MFFFGTLVLAGLVALGRAHTSGSLSDLPANVRAEAFHAPDWDPATGAY